MNQLMSDKGVCRTAPATTGLLNSAGGSARAGAVSNCPSSEGCGNCKISLLSLRTQSFQSTNISGPTLLSVVAEPPE